MTQEEISFYKVGTTVRVLDPIGTFNPHWRVQVGKTFTITSIENGIGYTCIKDIYFYFSQWERYQLEIIEYKPSLWSIL